MSIESLESIISELVEKRFKEKIEECFKGDKKPYCGNFEHAFREKVEEIFRIEIEKRSDIVREIIIKAIETNWKNLEVKISTWADFKANRDQHGIV